MKLVRFRPKGKAPMWGMWRESYVRVIVASPFEGMVVGTSEEYPLEEIELLAPTQPTKIVAVGLNYRDHAEELGMELPEEPLIFLKPPSAVIGHGQAIVCPKASSQVEYEAELGVVIGQRAKEVPAEEAEKVILGYTCVNDVTARDLQKKDIQFTRSKSFDTFCPIGPWIETEVDPSDLAVRSFLNDEPRQDSRTSQLIHGVPELVSFISSIMTLEPGDLICTGTPKGVGQIRPGDQVSIEVEGIGRLTNPVE